jgi:membrane protease YdiL (CAAX protease family)
VIFSAFVFGLLHFAYGSIVEVIGALLIGVVLGATFKITRNITPCILAHMVYNILAITFMRLIS